MSDRFSNTCDTDKQYARNSQSSVRSTWKYVDPLRRTAVVIPCWSEHLKLDVQLPPILMSSAPDVCTPDHTAKHCHAPLLAAIKLTVV